MALAPAVMIRSAPPGRWVPNSTHSQGFALHPSDEDLSVGTPVLGYSRRLPPGGARETACLGAKGIRPGSEEPSCHWPDPCPLIPEPCRLAIYTGMA